VEPDSDHRPGIGGIIRLGGALALHPVALSDAGELYGAIDRNRARLRQWLPWLHPEYSLKDTEEFLAQRVEENAARAALTLVMRSNGRICGAIGLHRIDPRHRCTSIGYWVDAECEGQGIVTRSCRAVVDAGFREYGLHRIEIRCAVGNHRSCSVPKRLGFIEEGLLREAEWIYDHWVNLRVFSMLESEWKPGALY
jgi:ribosomal-protein-serine acetyltransferase